MIAHHHSHKSPQVARRRTSASATTTHTLSTTTTPLVSANSARPRVPRVPRAPRTGRGTDARGARGGSRSRALRRRRRGDASPASWVISCAFWNGLGGGGERRIIPSNVDEILHSPRVVCVPKPRQPRVSQNLVAAAFFVCRADIACSRRSLVVIQPLALSLSTDRFRQPTTYTTNLLKNSRHFIVPNLTIDQRGSKGRRVEYRFRRSTSRNNRTIVRAWSEGKKEIVEIGFEGASDTVAAPSKYTT